MERTKELSALTDELKNCGKALIKISENLVKMQENADMPEKESATEAANEEKDTAEKKLPAMEDVRAVLAEKSRKGFTSQVKDLLKKYGANRLSEINPEKYEALLADAEVIENA